MPIAAKSTDFFLKGPEIFYVMYSILKYDILQPKVK